MCGKGVGEKRERKRNEISIVVYPNQGRERVENLWTEWDPKSKQLICAELIVQSVQTRNFLWKEPSNVPHLCLTDKTEAQWRKKEQKLKQKQPTKQTKTPRAWNTLIFFHLNNEYYILPVHQYQHDFF